ncbi:hypothetical protein CCMA1212_009350 [Trichoderma ghanense]|uniref:Uncharacterized protein n=1 Tax=Trichoderma ghanense TaxID=65468 RepID=A0ABY2GSJ4_9HYPO
MSVNLEVVCYWWRKARIDLVKSRCTLARGGPGHARKRRPLQYATSTASVPATDEPFRQLQLQWSLTGEPTAQTGSLRSPQETPPTGHAVH